MHCQPKAGMGIECEVSGSGAGGICFAAKHDITHRGATKFSMFVHNDFCRILPAAVLTTKREGVQWSVRIGIFEP